MHPPPATTIRVLVVDDIPCVRRAIRSLLAEDPSLEVVGEAADGSEALRSAVELRPDVVLMDIAMPVMDGLSATRLLSRLPHPPRILVMTEHDEDRYTQSAFEAGAGAFLPKGQLSAQLLPAVHAVL